MNLVDLGIFEVQYEADNKMYVVTEQLESKSREFRTLQNMLQWIEGEIKNLNIEKGA